MTISEDLFKGLNDRQCEAVECTKGPLLVLAGAGSGKTRILTHRIGYLIQNGVNPWNILAITFTNKAAREMRERTNRLLGSRMGEMVFVSTFHSMCVRLLRYDIDRLGYAKDFTIYDADDQRTLVRACIKSLKLDTKIYKDRAALGIISSSKNQMVDASEYTDSATDFYEKGIAKIYTEYEKQMKENNALDFDDLLLKTVELFKRFPEVLEKWQDRFIYIMVDEYQDTNNVQFELVRLLAAKNRNLCVVGDDDQSIYRFRGANIENILSFEKVFSGARVVKLEQNYRSTKSILNAANEVIKNNKGRKDKRLWTENEEGELPVFDEYETAAAEADAIVRKAYEASQNGLSLKDQAVLYRTNAQSRLLEEKCVRLNIPYVIVGGVNFYQRREIKDILSYLRVIANAVDDLACIRIINVPKRGIGQTSIDRVAAYAQTNGISFYDALLRCKDIPELKAASGKIRKFTDMIEAFRKTFSEKGSIRELIETVRDESGYADELKNEDAISAETRLENIEELINKAAGYEDEGTLSPQRAGYEIEDLLKLQEADYKAEHMSAMKAAAMKQSDMQTVPWDDDNSSTAFTAAADALNGAGVNEAENEGAENEVISGTEHDAAGDTPLARLSMFLEDISLVSDIDRADPNEEALTMMTLHAAKGLEFDTVYLCGMEEGLFPSSASINSSDPDEEIEEERRLCYVGFTRAMRRLCLSAALERMVNGETRYMKPSRFIDELPDDTAVKHFRRSHTPYGSVKSDSFAGFGGYEGRMEYGYSHGGDYGGGYKNGYGYSGYGTGSAYSSYDREQAYGGNSYGSERSSGGFGRYGQEQPSGGYGYSRAYSGGSSRNHDEDAYSAYNSFDNKSVRRFGSLDPTPAGRARKKASALAGLNGTPGISKGMGGNVKHKPDYVEGDRVMHTKFGMGTVLSITDEPKDYKVSVEFDEHGTKVMYAGFARLKKINS